MVSEDDLVDDIFGDSASTPQRDESVNTIQDIDELFGTHKQVDNSGSLTTPDRDKQSPPVEFDDLNLEAWVQESVMPSVDNTYENTPLIPPVIFDSTHEATEEKTPKKPRETKPPKPHKQRNIKAARQPRGLASGKTITAIGIVLVGLIGAGVFVVATAKKVDKPAAPSVIAVPQDVVPVIAVKNYPATNPPGYAAAPLSDQTVPATSVVAATEHGVVIVYGKKIGVYKSGVRISPLMVNAAAVKFVLSTKINGQDVIAWRAGNILNLWNPATPNAYPTKISMAPSITISSAGSNLLFHLKGDTFTTDGKKFTKITKAIRAGAAEPMAYDGKEVIAADAKSNVWKLGVGLQAGAATKVDLATPRVGLKLSKWVTAGYGNIVSIWRKPGDTQATVVVHSTDTGKIESQHVVDAGSVANETWIRGQGHKLAAFGGLLYDMATGKLVLDGIDQGIVFTRPFGKTVVGADGVGNLIFEYNKNSATAWRSDVNLLGLDSDGNAVVQPNTQTVQFFAPPM